MRRVVWVYWLLASFVAAETPTTLKLYNTILSALSSQEKKVLFVGSEELYDALKTSYRLVDDPMRADIAIVQNEEILEKIEQSKMCKPIVFATSYRMLKYHDRVVGALYWKKGRIQLLFIGERLEKCGIRLPETLQRYTVESL